MTEEQIAQALGFTFDQLMVSTGSTDRKGLCMALSLAITVGQQRGVWKSNTLYNEAFKGCSLLGRLPVRSCAL